jgi:hypothetical protein
MVWRVIKCIHVNYECSMQLVCYCVRCVPVQLTKRMMCRHEMAKY